MEELTNLIVQWHHDRNLIDGSSDKDKVLKLIQELGELSDSVCKGKDVNCLLYTSPSPRDVEESRMPSSA